MSGFDQLYAYLRVEVVSHAYSDSCLTHGVKGLRGRREPPTDKAKRQLDKLTRLLDFFDWPPDRICLNACSGYLVYFDGTQRRRSGFEVHDCGGVLAFAVTPVVHVWDLKSLIKSHVYRTLNDERFIRGSL